jgi:hypothetical protein
MIKPSGESAFLRDAAAQSRRLTVAVVVLFDSFSPLLLVEDGNVTTVVDVVGKWDLLLSHPPYRNVMVYSGSLAWGRAS